MSARSDASLVVAYDIGTTSAKTCLYAFGGSGAELVANASVEYGVRFLPNGGVEQDPDDWWRAVCAGTEAVLARAGAGRAECSAVDAV